MKKGNDVPCTFGNRLQHLRKAKKISQEVLAEKIGVSKRSIGFWERNEKSPKDIDTLIKLAEFFGVSVDYLLCRIDERNHDLHFICDETGLSEKAAETLIENRNRIMFHRDQESEQAEAFPEIVSSIIEHNRFLAFIYRLMQSRSADHKPVKPYQKERQTQIEDAHALLSTFGYSVLSPGENNLIYIFDAKQEIAGIIDDLFRIDQSENIELRN